MKYIALELGICVMALPGVLLWMSRSNPQRLPNFEPRVVVVQPAAPAETATVGQTTPGPSLGEPQRAKEPAVFDDPAASSEPAAVEPASVDPTPVITVAAERTIEAGTCGEYRDGKLTVQPCTQIQKGTADWLTKGSESSTGN